MESVHAIFVVSAILMPPCTSLYLLIPGVVAWPGLLKSIYSATPKMWSQQRIGKLMIVISGISPATPLIALAVMPPKCCAVLGG